VHFTFSESDPTWSYISERLCKYRLTTELAVCAKEGQPTAISFIRNSATTVSTAKCENKHQWEQPIWECQKGRFATSASMAERITVKDKRHSLSEDGIRIECVRCGKSPKLDKCKTTAEGHLKYFQRVHKYCNPSKTSEQVKKINEYFEPTEKRQKLWVVIKVLTKFPYSKQVDLSENIKWVLYSLYHYNIINNYSTSAYCRVGYIHLISNKREWNNCFVKNAPKILEKSSRLYFLGGNQMLQCADNF